MQIQPVTFCKEIKNNYGQVVADVSLVDEGDVAVVEVVPAGLGLARLARDLAELLRVLLGERGGGEGENKMKTHAAKINVVLVFG